MSSRLGRFAEIRLCSDAIVVEALRYVCFAAGPALFILGLNAVNRLAKTPGEILSGLLGAGTLATAIVILGLVLPFTRRPESSPSIKTCDE